MLRPNLARALLSQLAIQGMEPGEDPVFPGARSQSLQAGRSLVTLVLEGVAARQGARDPVCLGLVGPGDLLNFDAALGTGPDESALWLTRGRQVVISADGLIEAIDRDTLIETALADMRRRMEAARAEVTRHAHGRVTERLAGLLLDIHALVGATEVTLRQSDLADLLAVRRAGISTAAGELRATGAIRVRRAAILLSDMAALQRAAAGSVGEQAPHSTVTDLARLRG